MPRPAGPPQDSPKNSVPSAPPAGLLARWADLAYRRRGRVVLAWIGVTLVLGFVGSSLAGDWEADYATPGSESKAAAELLEQRFNGASGDSVDLVWEAEAGAQSPAIKKRVAAFTAKAAEIDYIGEPGETQVSKDGSIAATRLAIEGRAWDAPKESGTALIDLAEEAGGDGLTLAVGGNLIQNAEDQNPPEAAGLLAAMVILLIAFGSLIAVGLPLLTALFGLGIASLLIGLLAAVVPVPDWASAVSSLLGIGVGIDYALLVLTRFRASLTHGNDPHDALIETLSTAGRSVLVAGATVVLAVMGLFIVGVEYMRGVALATSISVLVVMFAAITLLPALLAFAGRRVNNLKIPGLGGASLAVADAEDGGHTLAARWSRQVQKRPWTMASVAAAVLIALAIPALSMNLGFPDASNDSPDQPTYIAYKLIEKGFG
ncbi:MAG: MMPL family transporter, partial [Solirubrobacterales bacterium]